MHDVQRWGLAGMKNASWEDSGVAQTSKQALPAPRIVRPKKKLVQVEREGSNAGFSIQRRRQIDGGESSSRCREISAVVMVI